MKKQYLRPVFKSYNQKQLMLLPPSLDDLIEPEHPVRIVDEVINNIDDTSLIRKYKGGGTSSYHPRMLLKVMIYSYLCNIYSSRNMETALKENIHFMWLSGMNRPDHNTLNRFRSEKLQDVLKDIFAQVVMMLAEAGHVSLKDVYLDGTKIGANANRYTFVWRKTIKYNKEKIVKQLNELWAYTQKVAAEELGDDTPTDFTPIDPEKIKETIAKIDEALKGKPVNKDIKAKLKHAGRHWAENMKKYLRYESLLGKRNSFSKTDPDATFMRMKEDHMRNGQLKPGYNLQITTSNQYILSYSLHHNPTDTLTLKSHLEQFESLYKKYPEALTADAGYGSEENYKILEDKNITAYVKYNLFEKDHKRRNPKPSFQPENMHYDNDTDSYQCPRGLRLIRTGTRKRTTENGYEQQYAIYQADNCEDCPLRKQCNKNEVNKTFEVNHQLNKYKIIASALLNSESGLYHRGRRPIDVEPVFANLKHNKGFKRFNLRGLRKVEIETGLLALAHNIKKKAA
jgi:transposase